MSLEIFEQLLVELCFNSSRYQTEKCIDFMVNCVTITNKQVNEKEYKKCEESYVGSQKEKDEKY